MEAIPVLSTVRVRVRSFVDVSDVVRLDHLHHGTAQALMESMDQQYLKKLKRCPEHHDWDTTEG